MKAAVYFEFGSPAVLKIQEIAKPTLKPDELLVKVRATTVSAVDSIYRIGKPYVARLDAGFFKPRKKVLGTDFAGEVVAIGTEVSKYQVGDLIYGSTNVKGGSHAEYISVSEEGGIAPIPEGLSFEEAASIPYGALTALPFLRDVAKVKAGQKVLIIGAAGGVGSMAVQIAKHLGAYVFAVASTSKIAFVQSLGADAVIDYTKEDFTKRVGAFDVIFDAAGKSNYKKSKAALNKTGVYMTTVLYLKILLQMLWTWNSKGKKAKFAATGLLPDPEKAKSLIWLNQLIEKGDLKPLVDRAYSLEEISEAHAYVDQGHKKGNVVIKM